MNISDAVRNYNYYIEYPLDSEEYQTALDVQLTIKSLYRLNKLNDLDIKVFEHYLSGYSYREIGLVCGISRHLASNRVRYILNILSQELQ